MRRLWPWLLVASFAFGLAASWHRWANPVIDGGREMNQPLRLVQGEHLYSEVGHIYGPLSPWFHAALYRAFGASLNVLYADGIVSSIVILTLVYHLARRMLDPAAAAAATLLVMWLCAFKPSGNYIFPYAYSALHGTLFSVATLALCAAALDRPSFLRFIVAGLAAAVTVLAKTELGIAALSAGIAAAVLARSEHADRNVNHKASFAVAFLLTALVLTGVVYGVIAARVGWRTLVVDSWLLAYNVPPPVKYFNASVSGLDHPAVSLLRMSVALIKVGVLGAIVVAIAQFRAGPIVERRRAWILLGGAAVLATLLVVSTGVDWDRGPFLAMPLVLVLTAVISAKRGQQLVLLYSVFALVALARIILHVRSGGAYGSFLLPVPIVVFTFAWIDLLPALFARPNVAADARNVALVVMLIAAIATSFAIAERYRGLKTAVATRRGTLMTLPQVAGAWNAALAFVDARTRPGDPIVVLPEGTSLTFLSGRRNPLREEIVTPGFLDDGGEARAIRQIDGAGTRLVMIVDRPTREFGAATFGIDYDRRLMAWIASQYMPCASFEDDLVRAYCR